MTFFYIVHVAVCVFLVLIILFQDGKTGGLVSVADTGNSVFGARGASNFLTKLTSSIAVLFMCTSLYLAFKAPGDKSIADDYVPPVPANSSTINPAPGSDLPLSGEVEFVDEEGNVRTKPLADAIIGEERFTEDQLPDDVKEDFERQKKLELEKAAGKKEAEKKKDTPKDPEKKDQ